MPTSPALQPAALLDVVDHGRRASWVERALAMAAFGGADPVALRGEPVGRLQENALDLHERLTGEVLDAVATCPGCAREVEFAVEVRLLLGLAPEGPDEGVVGGGGFAATWRVPRVADLLAATAADDPAAELRRRCLSATAHGGEIPVEQLPESIVDEAERAMAQGDPLAEVLVAVECPDCGTAFDADLDPIGFVWTDLEARAVRTLREVDELARSYGWTEDVILGLAQARRSAYLAIVRGERP